MPGWGEERLNLGGKGEQTPVPVVIKGPDAEPVARGKKGPGVLVPNGEGEHAAEPGQARGPELFVGVEDGLGIAVGLVSVTGAFEFRAEVGMVEDLAVVGNPQATIFIGHGLLAGGEVDDAETAMAEVQTIIREEPKFIGSPVRDLGSHPFQDRASSGSAGASKKAYYAAHNCWN